MHLSPIFNKAIDCGLVDWNSVHRMKKHKEESRDRYITEKEMVRLICSGE